MNAEEPRKETLKYFQKQSNCELTHCIEVAADRDGEHVVFVGGAHGNEPAGVEAMVAFHRRLQSAEIKLVRGKVSLLLGNPEAYQKNRRYVDRDLNRSFGDIDGLSLEGRRDSEIRQYLDLYDYISALLDLHSVSIGEFKICVYEKDKAQSLDLAMAISDIPLHFAYHPEHMPGTLIEAAGKHHISGLIVECGNHQSEQGVNTALDHMQAMLAQYQLIHKEERIPKKDLAAVEQYESISAIQPGSNFSFLIKDVATGTRLEKGQVFAQDDTGEHVAPQDCYIMAPSRIVKSTDYDAGFLCRLNQIRFSSTP